LVVRNGDTARVITVVAIIMAMVAVILVILSAAIYINANDTVRFPLVLGIAGTTLATLGLLVKSIVDKWELKENQNAVAARQETVIRQTDGRLTNIEKHIGVSSDDTSDLGSPVNTLAGPSSNTG
jgi:hypothetical protein